MMEPFRWFLPILAALLTSHALAKSRECTDDPILQQVAVETLPNLYRWTDTCNVFVLRSGAKAILFDLGDGQVLNQLRSIGVEHIDWVLFTHHHREQCQGVASVDRNRTRLAAGETERELFEAPLNFRKWKPNLGDRYSVYGASYVRPPRQPIAIDLGLKDGDIFQWEGFDIHCLETPGHSPGSMTYIIERGDTKIALSGDMVHQGSKMVTWFDTEWDYGFAAGLDTLIASVEKLMAQRCSILLPSHGGAIENPAEELETYRNKLVHFRSKYIRGYPVFDLPNEQRDSVSKPTAVPQLNQVTPHLYKLRDSKLGRNFAIIIADSGHALVLDCGLLPADELDQIILGAREHLGLKQIDAFWISHMHGDHFLLGPHLKEKYGAQAWTLDKIVDRCEHPSRYDYAALVHAYGDGFDGMPIDRPFRDGESIQWEGYRIQIDWMPGQTEFGCCLWLELDGKRIAFTGDNLFGYPADESQDGHEAVVARNSCLFEEGYLYAGEYLLRLKPDLIMGSHSFAMDQPLEFVRRYRDWAKYIIELYHGLLPETNYEYLFDPYWVSAYPYRVDLSEMTEATILVTVRNFRSQPQNYHVELKLPDGIEAVPQVLKGTTEAKSRSVIEVKLRRSVPARQTPKIDMATFDITLDGKRYGEWFDFLMLR